MPLGSGLMFGVCGPTSGGGGVGGVEISPFLDIEYLRNDKSQLPVQPVAVEHE